MVVALALSVGVGVGREIVQNWGDANNDYLDMASDIIAWATGPAAGWALVEGVLGWRSRKAR